MDHTDRLDLISPLLNSRISNFCMICSGAEYRKIRQGRREALGRVLQKQPGVPPDHWVLYSLGWILFACSPWYSSPGTKVRPPLIVSTHRKKQHSVDDVATWLLSTQWQVHLDFVREVQSSALQFIDCIFTLSAQLSNRPDYWRSIQRLVWSSYMHIIAVSWDDDTGSSFV